MTKIIYNLFYGRSLCDLTLLMISLIIIWSLLDRCFKYKLQKYIVWKRCNLFVFLCGVAGILIVTLMARNGSEGNIVLLPFNSFIEAQTQPEMYRSMFMNLFLFFPMGLALPYALPEKWKRNVLITILFALILSVAIEYLQYHYHLGRAETDDVICNTLGAAIGTLSYTLERKFFNK